MTQARTLTDPSGGGQQAFQPLIGAHFSIAAGFDAAVYTARSYKCNALQMFTKNATTWKERTVSAEEIERFQQARRKTGIEAISAHASYLINIASPDPEKHAMSARALKQELVRSSKLKIPFCVLHPGAHMGAGVPAGVRKIAGSLDEILQQIPPSGTRLLLETTAGQGTGIGHTFEQLAAILEKTRHRDRVGVCLDTCHIFAAGYDIRSATAYHQTMDAFASILGLNSLYAVHLNDSKKDFNSRVDRHEHIGRGFIGLAAFEALLNDPRLSRVPKYLETPKGRGTIDWDRRNLDAVRHLLHSEPLQADA